MERMTIGEFAREAGLTAKALRLYDEMGLMVPADVDPDSAYRYYLPVQLERARLVARLRLVGMPLARIREVADLPRASAAAAITSYWRQVEADVRTRRTRVHALVEEMRARESGMSRAAGTNSWTPCTSRRRGGSLRTDAAHPRGRRRPRWRRSWTGTSPATRRTRSMWPWRGRIELSPRWGAAGPSPRR
jgi:DNA-binding transcriptional MerR regulator